LSLCSLGCGGQLRGSQGAHPSASSMLVLIRMRACPCVPLAMQGNYAVSGGLKGCEAVEAKAKSFKARMTVSRRAPSSPVLSALYVPSLVPEPPEARTRNSVKARKQRLCEPGSRRKEGEATVFAGCGGTPLAGAAGGGRGVPHSVHAAGSGAAEGRAGGHTHRVPPHSGGLERRRKAALQPRGHQSPSGAPGTYPCQLLVLKGAFSASVWHCLCHSRDWACVCEVRADRHSYAC